MSTAKAAARVPAATSAHFQPNEAVAACSLLSAWVTAVARPDSLSSSGREAVCIAVTAVSDAPASAFSTDTRTASATVFCITGAALRVASSTAAAARSAA